VVRGVSTPSIRRERHEERRPRPFITSRGQSEAAGRNRRRRPAASLWPGEVAGWGVERVDADALSSLTCAGWLPQDRGFEIGVGPLV
jgi:hypothetical protein